MTEEQGIMGASTRAKMTATGGTTGTFSGVFTLNDEQVQALKDEEFIVQLYTQDNPLGELRGQLRSEVKFDLTAEDMLGIWQNKTNPTNWHWQVYEDGTQAYLETLDETGKRQENTWSLNGNIATYTFTGTLCDGENIAFEEHYKDGLRRFYTLSTEGSCKGDIGTWTEWIKVDEEGNRVYPE